MNSDLPTTAPVKRVGELLVESGMVPKSELERGLEYGKKTGLPIGRVLIMLKIVTDEDLQRALNVQNLMRFEHLQVPMALKALGIARQNNVPIEKALKIAGWTGDKFKGAEPQELTDLKQKLAMIEDQHGPEHPDNAHALSELADFYSEHDMWPHAESHYRNAMAKLEAVYGVDDMQVANVCLKLANTLFLQDRYEESAPLYLRVFKIRRNVLGLSHQDVGSALYDLGEVHDALGKHKEAEKFYLAALVIREQIYEVDAEPTLMVLRRISYVCRRRGRMPDQILLGQLLAQAGLISESVLPEALEYAKQNGLPLARALVTMQQLREDDLQPSMHAQLLIRTNLLPSPVAVRALKISVKRHMPMPKALDLVGWTGHELGKTYELAALLRISDELIEAEKVLPPNDPMLAVLCARLAEQFSTNDRHADAEGYYRRALNIIESTNPDALGIAEIADRLGLVAMAQEKYDDAHVYFLRGLQVRERQLGKEHSDVSKSYVNLAKTKTGRNSFRDALVLYQRALEIREERGEEDSMLTGVILEAMADCHFDLQEFHKAEPLFWRAYRVKKQHMKVDDPDMITMLKKLAETYTRQGLYVQADSVMDLFQASSKEIVW